jgi:Transposase IS4
MMECLDQQHHHLWMDNLYISAKFAKGCYNHSRKVLLAGVCRKGMRGIPQIVMQQEVKPAEVKFVRGTVKVAVLKGDENCPNMIAASVYDAKPVYFISMIHKEIKWVKNINRVYSKVTKKMEDNLFLRLNINTDYNHKMNSVDSADQLRNSYRFDHWLRMRKWWWSIFFWGMGVLLVNAYVSYVKFNLMNGKKKNELLSHYEFRKAIALAWLDPDQYDTKDKVDDTVTPVSRKRKASEYEDSEGRATRGSVGSKMASIKNVKRANKVTNASLDPNDGLFANRLKMFPRHWPVEPSLSKRPKCAFHRWAADLEEKTHVVMCSECKVHLCIGCFKMFHEEVDLKSKKFDICCQLLDQKKKGRPNKRTS